MPTTPRQVTSPSPILQELIALGVVRMAADGKTPIVGNAAAPLVGYEEDPITGRIRLSPSGSVLPIAPEFFGAVAYPTRAEAEVGTDSSVAMQSALDSWYSSNGGVLFLSGWYRVTTAFLLANSNTASVFGSQPPLRITGIGGHASGRGIQANAGCGIVWTAETGAAVAKIDTRGNGLIVLDNCTFASKSGSGNTKPFVHTTFTVIKTGAGFALDGATYGASAAEDGFVLGGQSDHEGIPGFDLTSSDCGFQGYGTVIDSVHCNGLRRLAILQRYANAIRITNNCIWSTCGNNSATGGAIEVNGAPIAPSGYSVGAYIHGNLIEVTNYKYGIHLKNALHVELRGNDAYDATAMTLAAVYVDPSCVIIRIGASLAPAGKAYVLPDPTTVANIFITGSEQSFYDVSSAIYAGFDGYPNKFGATNFLDPINTVFQSRLASGNAKLITAKRSAADASDAGAEVYSVSGDASVNLGNLAGAGNLVNGLPSGASYWSNGRNWGFNGLTGGNMSQNSGTGGSTYTAQNYSFIWKDHSGVVVGRVGNLHGGGSLAGISVGTAYDTEWYRYAAGVWKSNGKVLAATGLGVGNSASASALGTLSKKMEVFDATGASLGFVPIYTTIT